MSQHRENAERLLENSKSRNPLEATRERQILMATQAAVEASLAVVDKLDELLRNR
jgi:hypothetical protein